MNSAAPSRCSDFGRPDIGQSPSTLSSRSQSAFDETMVVIHSETVPAPASAWRHERDHETNGATGRHIGSEREVGLAQRLAVQVVDDHDVHGRVVDLHDAALFPFGGVGAVLFGWLMDRYNANRIIAIGYALTAVAIYAIGQAAGSVGSLVVVVFVAGTLMNTAQSSMPALAAAYYPTRGRATGVAWMLGIGRFGGIAGSFLVAELAARHLAFSQVFAVVAAPGAVAAIALLVKQFAAPKPAADSAAPIAVVLGQ